MSDLIVEVVQFRVARGVDEEVFLKASDAAQSFLTKAKGFVSRELVRTADGLNWIDIVKWRTASDAEHAARNAARDPRCAKFFELVEKSSVRTQHMERTRLYE